MRTQFAFHKQFFLATRHRTDGLSFANNILKQRNWRCDIEPAMDELGYHPHYPLRRGVKIPLPSRPVLRSASPCSSTRATTSASIPAPASIWSASDFIDKTGQRATVCPVFCSGKRLCLLRPLRVRCMDCQNLPLRGRQHRAAMTERVSPLTGLEIL